MIALVVDAGRQRAEGASPWSPASREAQNASATAGSPWRTSSEPCSASAIRSTTPARAALEVGRKSRSSRAQRVDERVEPRVGAARPARPRRRTRRPTPGSRPIARSTSRQMTLPEPSQMPVQRRLAEEARQDRLLDVAVAAQALERLGDQRGLPLAHPVLRHRGGEARERAAALVARALVVGARQPHHRDRRRLGLDAQVGEHVLHQRLLDQPLAERACDARAWCVRLRHAPGACRPPSR